MKQYFKTVKLQTQILLSCLFISILLSCSEKKEYPTKLGYSNIEFEDELDTLIPIFYANSSEYSIQINATQHTYYRYYDSSLDDEPAKAQLSIRNIKSDYLYEHNLSFGHNKLTSFKIICTQDGVENLLVIGTWCGAATQPENFEYYHISEDSLVEVKNVFRGSEIDGAEFADQNGDGIMDIMLVDHRFRYSEDYSKWSYEYQERYFNYNSEKQVFLEAKEPFKDYYIKYYQFMKDSYPQITTENLKDELRQEISKYEEVYQDILY